MNEESAQEKTARVFGEAREDGFRFRQYKSTPAGTREIWLSPAAWERDREANRLKCANYRVKHLEKVKQGQRNHYTANRTAVLEKTRVYRAKNKKAIQDRDKAYRKKNMPAILAANAAWVKANLDKVREIKKRWALRNPDAIRAVDHTRRLRKYQSLVSLTPEKRKIRKAIYGIRKRLSKCLQTPMHVDHIISLRNGGSDTAENLLPIPRWLNHAKGARSVCSLPLSMRSTYDTYLYAR